MVAYQYIGGVMLKLLHKIFISIDNRLMAMCRNTDGSVCCRLMNVVVYNLKSLISVMKAFVSKSNTPLIRQHMHASIHRCLSSFTWYTFPSIRVTG